MVNCEGEMMLTFRWLVNNAVIECESYDDLGQILKLYNGIIKHPDESLSKFDLLILQKDEAEKIEEQPQKIEARRSPRRARRW